MHVIRHDYVPYQPEPVPLSHLSQRANKNVSRPGSSKERQPPITTEGEKVQVPTAVVPLQSNGHGSVPKLPHATPACGAPFQSNAQVTYEGGILSSSDEVKRKERLPACVWATRPVIMTPALNLMCGNTGDDLVGDFLTVCPHLTRYLTLSRKIRHLAGPTQPLVNEIVTEKICCKEVRDDSNLEGTTMGWDHSLLLYHNEFTSHRNR
jgi:hypothetical protein